jgi:flagellar biosynthesis repressor protein FlbT
MPLSIPLPAGAKIIINGAVIQNTGAANITLTVHNMANILRDKDVLTPAEADTPAKEIYYAVQNAYLFADNRGEWENIAHALLDRYQAGVPAAAEITGHIRSLMQGDKLYNALRASRRLIALESGEPAEPAHPDAPPPGPSRPGAGSPPAPHRPDTPPAEANPRQEEIGRIRGKLAELERRLAAIDPHG